jgi:biotin transport system substrate-specific component
VTVAISPRPIMLADLVPRTRVRAVGLVVAFALLTAGAAQLSFHIPWTPVPVTGQTFAVLLAGSALGWRLGAASQALYVVLGAVGLPFYAAGASGWKAATGSSSGYLVGFVVAAAVVGRLAARGQDRTLVTSLQAMLAGSAVIYVFGVTWLAHDINVSAARAVELGMTPFVIGDTLKLIAAGLLLPATWRLVDR